MSTETQAILTRLAGLYPANQVEVQRQDIPRIAFNLDLVTSLVPRGSTIADIGGGIGLFSPGAAALGYKSVLVDDFGDWETDQLAVSILQGVHRSLGVEIISRDVISDGIDFEPKSLGAVTSFDSLEHWHHSPKLLLRQLMAALIPGGILVIGAPNCVNLRKRLTVPLGNGKWSNIAEWYESRKFRGHVREPDVDDLRYIARDLDLIDCRIIGRNWLGYRSRFRWVRKLTPIVDRPLRIAPSFCADLYLIGRKQVG